MVTGSCLSYHPARACYDSMERGSSGTPSIQQAKAASSCVSGVKSEIKQQQQAPPLSIKSRSLPVTHLSPLFRSKPSLLRLLKSGLLQGVQLFS